MMLTRTKHVLTSCVMLLTASLPAWAASGFEIAIDEAASHADVSLDGTKIGRYMFAFDQSTDGAYHDTYKPYLHVFDPTGTFFITKGAGGKYTHHRGIFIGFKDLKFTGADGVEHDYDRWHMKGGAIIHQEFVASDGGADHAVLTVRNHWMHTNNEAAFAVEERTMRFHRVPAKTGRFALDFSSVLTPIDGEIKLTPHTAKKTGDAEHNGVQFRAADDVLKEKTVYVLPVDGVPSSKKKTNRDFEWGAIRFHLPNDPDDQGHFVLMMNHPSNPTDTLWSVYRDYGRFGAVPNGTATTDSPFSIKYRYIVAAGEALSKDEISGLQAAFAAE